MGTLDFGLHKILIYAMKNGQGKGGKYLEKEKEKNIFLVEEQKNGEGRGGKYLENEVFSCGGEGVEEAKLLRTGGSIKGPREPKSIR